jgi:hypothetical protein
MVGFIYYVDGQQMPTLTYHLNGERVNVSEAHDYFLTAYARDSNLGYCDAGAVDEYWDGRYNEIGREVICTITNEVLEISAYYYPE